jgi:2-phosphoglycerate kinase
MQILLIGGSSGTGKTVLARALSQHWGIPALQVDDFRLVLRRVMKQAKPRAGGDTDLWDQTGLRPIYEVWEQFTGSQSPPEQMAEGLAAVARVMSGALEIVIAHHIATRTPVIIEGDGLLPSLAVQSQFDNMTAAPGEVRAVFLVEDQEQRLFNSALQRGRGFEEGGLAEQRRIIRANWLFGQWLKMEAQRLSLPVLAPHPWETLADRVLEAII